MIQIEGVTKEFRLRDGSKGGLRSIFAKKERTIRAVDNLSLKLKEGEIFGLLGPNGAGKTTLTKMLCGLLEPSSGRILIDGGSVEENKYKIGLMLGNTMKYNRLTGRDNLEFFASLYNVGDSKERIDEVAGFLEISDFLDDYVEVYSTGMKTKLSLARILVHDPQILILDEPTLGLDPHISLIIRDKILEMKGMGKTILLTTHYMDEADHLCSRIGLLNKGRLVKVGTAGKLKDSVGKEGANLSDVFIKLTGDEL